MGGGEWEGDTGGSGQQGKGMCQTGLSRNIHQVHSAYFHFSTNIV